MSANVEFKITAFDEAPSVYEDVGKKNLISKCPKNVNDAFNPQKKRKDIANDLDVFL